MIEEVKEKFGDFLTEHGAVDLDEIQLEKSTRFSVVGDKGDQMSGAYTLYINKGNGVPAGFMNNHRAGTYEKWSGKVVSNSSVPIDKKAIEQRKAYQAAVAKERQLENYDKFKKDWESMIPAIFTHPYAKDKNLKKTFFVRTEVRQDAKKNLVFPIKDKSGKITNLQRVWRNGNKQLEKGGTLKESFVRINGEKPSNFVIVAEGVSTGGTVNDITGVETYASLTGNNLTNVAKVVRELNPNKQIIIAGDNDFHLTIRDIPLKNSGVENAEKAAEKVGGHVALPPFKMLELSVGKTDWNDFYKDNGFVKTKSALRDVFQKVVESTKEKQTEIER
jgi:phage/plasmid primase-like uncharacterized protein